MALKSWIDEIRTDKSGSQSGALLDPAGAPAEESFPGEKEADKILFTAQALIIEGGVFYGTPETRAAEADVDRSYKAIINGGRDFDALVAACTRWVEAARKAPAPLETISLF